MGDLLARATAIGISVKDAPYNAKGDGKTDDTAAIQAALNSGAACVLLPQGNFKISTPLIVPANVQFIGLGRLSNLVANKVTGGVVRTRPAASKTWPENQVISNINISGTADTGLVWHGAIAGKLENVTLKGLTANIGFDFCYCWGCTLDNLLTNGATISDSCFYVRSFVSANTCNNWYTSNPGCVNNLLIDNTVSVSGEAPGAGEGNTWNTPTFQGGRYGMWLKAGNSNTFNSIFCENVVTCVKVGDAANNKLVNGLTLNAPLFAVPSTSNSGYGQQAIQLELDAVWNCTVNSPTFVYVGNITSLPIVFNNARKILINEGFVQGNGSSYQVSLGNYVYRRAEADGDCGVTIIGTGANNRFELTTHGDSFGWKHWILSIKDDGTWLSTPLTIPKA